jgi:hypothetical protein
VFRRPWALSDETLLGRRSRKGFLHRRTGVEVADVLDVLG